MVATIFHGAARRRLVPNAHRRPGRAAVILSAVAACGWAWSRAAFAQGVGRAASLASSQSRLQFFQLHAQDVAEAELVPSARNDTSPEIEAPITTDGKKVGIITGAASGIGLKTVEGMAKSGLYDVIIMAGRNETKHNDAIAEVVKILGSNASAGIKIKHMHMELSSLESVRDFVSDFQALGLPLHTLVLNAGVFMLPQRKVTEDGFEYQMGVNHLSHFLLANLLLKDLVDTATATEPGRIISLSSSLHGFPSKLLGGSISDLQSVDYTPSGAYAQSKLANLLFAYELDRRCTARGLPIAVNALHPGVVNSELFRYIIGENSLVKSLQQFTRPFLSSVGLKTVEEGAKTSVLLATTDFGKMSGRYWEDEKPAASVSLDFSNGFPETMRMRPPSYTSYDPAVWEDLWNESEKLVGLTIEDMPVFQD